jgi:hypothetical protein
MTKRLSVREPDLHANEERGTGWEKGQQERKMTTGARLEQFS